MAKRAPLYLGLLLAGGTGYYMYSAGGDYKVAEKNFEHDVQAVRQRATGSGNQIRAEAEKYSAEAGAKVDAALSRVETDLSRTSANAREFAANAKDHVETYGKDVRDQVNKSADAFDKKVDDVAAKTRSGISGWFGGK